MIKINPFSVVRASEYSDRDIEELWVDRKIKNAEEIFKPFYNGNIYFLGAKGSGKTHLLRYFFCKTINEFWSEDFFVVFTRSGELRNSVFTDNIYTKNRIDMNKYFGLYFELHLVEIVLSTMLQLKKNNNDFNDDLFLANIKKDFYSYAFEEYEIKDIEGLLCFIGDKIDELVEFIDDFKSSPDSELNYKPFFYLGGLYRGIAKHLRGWCKKSNLNLVYAIDELEEISLSHQKVLNYFVRKSDGKVCFRIAGRTGSIKTKESYMLDIDSEIGSEFSIFDLDRHNNFDKKDYLEFAKEFINKKLKRYGLPDSNIENEFEICADDQDFFENAFMKIGVDEEQIYSVVERKFSEIFGFLDDKSFSLVKEGLICRRFPLVICKLNILLFVKKYKVNQNIFDLAIEINRKASGFIDRSVIDESYKTAYNHYKNDLFSQLLTHSNKQIKMPYTGFEDFCRMSMGNPRSLLIILERIYDKAYSNEEYLFLGAKASIRIQSLAALEVSQFASNQDSNYGEESEKAKLSVRRLAELLRVARYSDNIPEVSPLAVSLNIGELSQSASTNFRNAKNFRFIFEGDGHQVSPDRPDRNSNQINSKIYLNLMWSPRWELPISIRGDIKLNSKVANAIFDPDFDEEDFLKILSELKQRWTAANKIKERYQKSNKNSSVAHQQSLF